MASEAFDSLWIPEAHFPMAKKGSTFNLMKPNVAIHIHQNGWVFLSRRFVLHLSFRFIYVTVLFSNQALPVPKTPAGNFNVNCAYLQHISCYFCNIGKNVLVCTLRPYKYHVPSGDCMSAI